MHTYVAEVGIIGLLVVDDIMYFSYQNFLGWTKTDGSCVFVLCVKFGE